MVIRDVHRGGLNDAVMLPESDAHDSVLCSHIVHVRSVPHILVGTFSGAVLVYTMDGAGWRLVRTLHLALAVYAIASPQLSPGGSLSLVLTCADGFHIFDV